MDRAQKSRLETDYWYREGSIEGAWSGFLACLPPWAIISGIMAVFSFWLKRIPLSAWLMWALPICIAATIWLYFKWLNWRHPVTK